MNKNPLDRHLGCLLGLAVGDAVGTTLEFTRPGTFEPISDMIGGGPFYLQAGQWTDDTSMALCLADSLLASKGFSAHDQMKRYLRWFLHGYNSSIGRCFDIGGTTRSALREFEETGNYLAGSISPNSAGNGSIMRLAPIPMFYKNPDAAVFYSGESSITTHAAPTAVSACQYLGGLIYGALHGVSKDVLLGDNYSPSQNPDKLAPEITEIAYGSFKDKNPPDIKGTGYVVESLEAALWAFYNSNSYRDGLLLAVNLGNDADTTGAVYGQLAGAYYGETGIPNDWVDTISMSAWIKITAQKLMEQGY